MIIVSLCIQIIKYHEYFSSSAMYSKIIFCINEAAIRLSKILAMFKRVDCSHCLLCLGPGLEILDWFLRWLQMSPFPRKSHLSIGP